ncbi:hypothetical protein [Elstera sp.]|jgi:hypothetical protein
MFLETVLDGLASAIDIVIAKEKTILDVARALGFTVDVLKEA